MATSALTGNSATPEAPGPGGPNTRYIFTVGGHSDVFCAERPDSVRGGVHSHDSPPGGCAGGTALPRGPDSAPLSVGAAAALHGDCFDVMKTSTHKPFTDFLIQTIKDSVPFLT